MHAFLEWVPSWLGVLGWVVVLVGFLLQRKALMNARIQSSIKGNQNQVNNTINQSMRSDNNSDGLLSQVGTWASIVGLVLSLLPLIKAWLGLAT